MPMSVRVLTRADAAAFRELRLRALKENPEAFTSSYEEAVLQPLECSGTQNRGCRWQCLLGRLR